MYPVRPQTELPLASRTSSHNPGGRITPGPGRNRNDRSWHATGTTVPMADVSCESTCEYRYERSDVKVATSAATRPSAMMPARTRMQTQPKRHGLGDSGAGRRQ